MMIVVLSMKITAVKSTRVIALRDRLFQLPMTEGFNFHPFEVPRRELLGNELPQSPLSLFQHFIPISIVKEWVKYTNDWVTSLIQRGVVDSQEHEMKEKSCLNAWKPIIIIEIYIWLGILIYMGVYNEIMVKDYWKTSRLEN